METLRKINRFLSGGSWVAVSGSAAALSLVNVRAVGALSNWFEALANSACKLVSWRGFWWIMSIAVGIITVSDRASQGVYEDHGGPALRAECGKRGWTVQAEAVVPDEQARIRDTIRAFSAQGCGLVLTTGGTGVADRDVTPEAIREIMRLEIPGFGEIMRMRSFEITPNAVISRCLGAMVDSSLVLALPGKPSGAVECLGFVEGAIPHSVKLALKEPTSC